MSARGVIAAGAEDEELRYTLPRFPPPLTAAKRLQQLIHRVCRQKECSVTADAAVGECWPSPRSRWRSSSLRPAQHLWRLATVINREQMYAREQLWRTGFRLAPPESTTLHSFDGYRGERESRYKGRAVAREQVSIPREKRNVQLNAAASAEQVPPK